MCAATREIYEQLKSYIRSSKKLNKRDYPRTVHNDLGRNNLFFKNKVNIILNLLLDLMYFLRYWNILVKYAPN